MKLKMIYLALALVLIFSMAAVVLPASPAAAQSQSYFIDSGQSLGDSQSWGVALGDVDGDGDLDAFIANFAYWNPIGQPNKVWLNDGNGVFTDSGQSLGHSSSSSVALGDVDGDGDLDAFIANSYGQADKIWLNNGYGVFTDSGQSLGGSGRNSKGVALGDVDGDGDLDAFVATLEANHLWLNNGYGVFADSGQSVGNFESNGVDLGDVDGDGDLDAYISNVDADQVWLNNGSGVFTDSGQSLGTYHHMSADLGDVDGDGDLDVFITTFSFTANEIWLNNGSGIFTDSGQSLGTSISLSADLGDVDGDGDLDAFVSNSGADKVWLNDGSGVFTDSGQSLGGNVESRDVDLGDVDGDGDLDAFTASARYVDPGPGNIVWLNNNLPNQPNNNLPLNGATAISLTPTLTSSAFDDPDTGDTHAASQWQLTTTLGDYTSPVYDSGTDSSNLESITITPGNLNYDTTNYWHVRHQDNHSVWSDWSTETSFTTAGTSLADTPWPMYRHDLLHTGRSPYSGSANPVLGWSFFLGSHSHSPPVGGLWHSTPAVGADGTIYVGSYDGNLYAINPDGTEKWHYPAGGSSSPAIGADGTIYVGSYAINPDGTEKWHSPAGAGSSSPAIGADGTIYVGTYAINPDGSVKWYFSTGVAVYSSPAVGADGTIYVGSDNHNLYAMNPDGSEKWRFDTGRSVRSSPAIGADGTIYVDSYAINPDGTEKWHFPAGTTGQSSPAIGADGTIYIGSGESQRVLYAINPDGTEKWRSSIGYALFSSPVIGADGTIYVGDYLSSVYAINADGSQKWRFGVGYVIYCTSLAIGADGTIYVCPEDNKLYAITQDANNNVPDQPSNIFPVPGATDVNLTPNLESSAFSDPDAGDTLAKSQWQIRTSSGSYASPIFDQTITSSLPSITVLPGTLSYSNTYYWHVRHQDNHGGWSSYSTETSFTTEEAPEYILTINTVGSGSVSKNPNQPTYTHGTIVELTATADPGWTFSSWSDDLTGNTNPDTIVVDDYRTVTATFIENQPPNQPSNDSPTNGATSISMTPTLTSSFFSDPDISDTHFASQWQITTTSEDYTSPIFSTADDLVNLTSIIIGSSTLDYDTTYYWHVRHQDNHLVWSDWSTETSFTTTSPNTPINPNVTIPLSCATITFDNVTVAGDTSCTTQQGNPGGGIPEGFRVRGQFVDVVTTASYEQPGVEVCIPYDPSTPNPENLKLFHDEGGHWVDATTDVDTVNYLVCGYVASLSWFFIGGEWVWIDDATGVPVFPTWYIGLAAALGAGVIAYVLRRRYLGRKSEGV